MSEEWPVRVRPLGPVAVGCVLWRWAGQLNVTVAVKACFAIEPEAVMRVCPPEPLRRVDEHFGAVPTRSVAGARELAPQLTRCDVTLIGHAYAPGGAAQAAARLAMSRDGQTVLDKTIHVYGDRGPSGEPMRFEAMALEYERAYGGIGFVENPLGVGAPGSPEREPNLVALEGAPSKVAGFGPIPSMFPARRKLLRGAPRKSIEAMQANIPDDFDWSYFQAAPRDQQLEVLRGDEWLGLDGLHPTTPRLRTRLPGLRGWARVIGHDRIGAPDAVPLRPDTLHIEPDRNCVSMVCRGGFPIPDEAAAERIIIIGTLAPLGASVAWPAEEAPRSRAPKPKAPPPPRHGGSRATAALDPELEAAAARFGTAAPFRIAPARAIPAGYRPVEPLPGAPWSTRSAPDVQRPTEGASDTLQIDLGAASESVRDAARAAAEALGVAPAAALATPRKAPSSAAEPAPSAVDAAAEARAACERAAAERAAAEAEARRAAEAERFKVEQEAARRVQEEREAEERRQKKEAAKNLKTNLYGNFKRKT